MSLELDTFTLPTESNKMSNRVTLVFPPYGVDRLDRNSIEVQGIPPKSVILVGCHDHLNQPPINVKGRRVHHPLAAMAFNAVRSLPEDPTLEVATVGNSQGGPSAIWGSFAAFELGRNVGHCLSALSPGSQTRWPPRLIFELAVEGRKNDRANNKGIWASAAYSVMYGARSVMRDDRGLKRAISLARRPGDLEVIWYLLEKKRSGTEEEREQLKNFFIDYSVAGNDRIGAYKKAISMAYRLFDEFAEDVNFSESSLPGGTLIQSHTAVGAPFAFHVMPESTHAYGLLGNDWPTFVGDRITTHALATA